MTKRGEMQCVVADISWFQSNNKCLQACVPSRTQNIPNLLVITCFIRQICNWILPFFFSLSAIISFSTLCLYNELIAARVCFSNHNVDKHKIRAQTLFTKSGRQLQKEKKTAMLIIFAFCFVVIHIFRCE